MYSDASVDYFKVVLLNVPALVVTVGALFLFDFSTNFSACSPSLVDPLAAAFLSHRHALAGVTYLIELPEPLSFLFTWGVVIPGIFFATTTITNSAIKDPLILKGPCPNCGAQNWVFFGEIFGIEVRTWCTQQAFLINHGPTVLTFAPAGMHRATRGQALCSATAARARWSSTRTSGRLCSTRSL